MIQQIESKYPAIRGWGCLMMVYFWGVAKKFGIDYDMIDVEQCYNEARLKNIILTNDKPTDGSQGEWYRCWVRDPIAWMKLVANHFGKESFPILLYKTTKNNATEAPLKVIENASVMKSGFGVHFTGEFANQEYNPDVRINLASMISIRGWSI